MQRRVMLMGAAGAAFFLVGMPAFAAGEDPFNWVVTVSNGVLDAIRADPELQNGDAEALQKLVDEKIMPSVDFPMVTRMTVGPKWRQATKEERVRLQNGFERLLMRVYAGALKNVRDNTCELRPTRNRRVADEMVVRTLLKAPGQPDIALDYRIYRNKSGEWKIVDVNVEGIWMVENYRAQFASTLSNEGIAGLIKLLEEKSDELAQKNASTIGEKKEGK